MDGPGATMTVLVENTAGGRGLLAEHGLALWIETGGQRILFDTGQGYALQDNARLLGIDLSAADAVVLSHGHYDHTGGLHHVLSPARPMPVYAHPEALKPKYAAARPGSPGRDIGIPPADLEALRNCAQFNPVEEPCEIPGGFRLTGPVPRITDFEDTGGAFFVDPECTAPDTLPDDQAAFLETSQGAVVILGCAHAGVINTLRYIAELTNRPIHTVIGGMHLVHADESRLGATVEELRRLEVRRLLPCHCTGFDATAFLFRELPGVCETCRTGSVLRLPA